MPAAARTTVPGQGDVDALLGQHPTGGLGLENFGPSGIGGVDGLAGQVDPLAGVGLGGRRERADLPAGQ